MRTNLAIAALIFPMIQAMAFGLGLLALLVTRAPDTLYPVMIAASFLVSLPLALMIAPRLRSKTWRSRYGARFFPSERGANPQA